MKKIIIEPELSHQSNDAYNNVHGAPVVPKTPTVTAEA